jgi:hypothetical protein
VSTAVAALAAVLALAAPSLHADVTEPKSGATFAERVGDMSLLGVGLRTKTMLKVKVYAVGLYAADSALPALKGKSGDALANELVWGDYPKQITMKFLRDLSTEQIRGAFEEVLGNTDAAKRQAFLSYFGELKAGQEATLRWTPGGTLETTVAGQPKAPIADKDFAAAVYGIWLGQKAIQADIKEGLISRVPR